MKNDYLFIEKMELPCRIGTTPEERAFPQVLLVSIKIELSLAAAGKSDDLDDTIDYARVVADTQRIGSAQTFNLAERLAQVIADKILSQPLVDAVEVKIEKKVFAGIQSVGATIRREK